MRSQAARAAVFFSSDIKDNRLKGGKAVRQMIAQATAGSKQSLPLPPSGKRHTNCSRSNRKHRFVDNTRIKGTGPSI